MAPSSISLPSVRAARLSDPLLRLAPWPALRRRVLRRAGAFRPAEESPDAFENRLGTALMAVWRDERSAEVFEALYAFAEPAVASWIQNLLVQSGERLDPSELVQDTFVNVFRYPRAFRDEHSSSFRVWVRTIAGNLVRRARTARARGSFQDLPEGLQEPEDGREGPVAALARHDESRRLQSAWMLFLVHYARAWEELRPRDRLTLHLVEVERKSYEEVGQLLGVGRSNMKMIVFRARKRIAQKMRAAMCGGRDERVLKGAA